MSLRIDSRSSFTSGSFTPLFSGGDTPLETIPQPKEWNDKYTSTKGASRLWNNNPLPLLALADVFAADVKGGKDSRGDRGGKSGGRSSSGGFEPGYVREKTREPSVVDRIKTEAGRWHPKEANIHIGNDGVSIDVKVVRERENGK